MRILGLKFDTRQSQRLRSVFLPYRLGIITDEPLEHA